jgi:hypothetical protein
VLLVDGLTPSLLQVEGYDWTAARTVGTNRLGCVRRTMSAASIPRRSPRSIEMLEAPAWPNERLVGTLSEAPLWDNAKVGTHGAGPHLWSRPCLLAHSECAQVW